MTTRADATVLRSAGDGERQIATNSTGTSLVDRRLVMTTAVDQGIALLNPLRNLTFGRVLTPVNVDLGERISGALAFLREITIVDAHGGSIAVQSTSSGTTFEIAFPSVRGE